MAREVGSQGTYSRRVTLTEFAQLLAAAGVGGSSLSTSRAVWNDVKYAEVFVKHFLRWNDFGGLSI